MSLHRKQKATCSCHPETFAAKFAAAVEMEAASIGLAFVLGLAIGVSLIFVFGNVKFERHRLGAALQVPNCSESKNCELAYIFGPDSDVAAKEK